MEVWVLRELILQIETQDEAGLSQWQWLYLWEQNEDQFSREQVAWVLKSEKWHLVCEGDF